jgi:hypothetical protein
LESSVEEEAAHPKSYKYQDYEDDEPGRITSASRLAGMLVDEVVR